MSSLKEVWKDIPGFEGFYQASNLGRIRSKERTIKRKQNRGVICNFTYKSEILSQHESEKGYLRVTLYRMGETFRRSVHRLVASAFLGEKRALEVNHINFDKKNNRLENLEWVTSQQNSIHTLIHGRNPRVKLNPEKIRKVRKTYERGMPLTLLAEMLDVSSSQLSNILLSKSWGFVK